MKQIYAIPFALLFVGSAFAQSPLPTETAPASQSALTYQAELPPGRRSVQLQDPGGPVTLTWGQPQTVPNISDYRVRIVDLDANGDGVLTRDEVPESHALSSEFKLVDSNRDGRITAEELENWR
ncbi:hypothetical protein [Pseudoxanthomonas wuyuanensis]